MGVSNAIGNHFAKPVPFFLEFDYLFIAILLFKNCANAFDRHSKTKQLGLPCQEPELPPESAKAPLALLR